MSIDVYKLSVEEILALKEKLFKIVSTPVLSLKEWTVLKYSELDWSKSNTDLALEMHVSEQSISNWRRKLGKPPALRKERYRSKYCDLAENWDWSKSNSEIARENKLSINTVLLWRKKLGKPPGPREPIDPLPDAATVDDRVKVDWSGINWKQADIDIARACGCTRERVRQKRIQLGLPKYHAWEEKFDQFKQVVGDRKTLMRRDHKEFGISELTLSRYCAKLGIALIRPEKECIIPWDKMNWDLPNSLLTNIWGLRPNSAATQRCNHTHSQPKFRATKGRYDPEWEPLVKAEIEKARQYFSQHSDTKQTEPECALSVAQRD